MAHGVRGASPSNGHGEGCVEHVSNVHNVEVVDNVDKHGDKLRPRDAKGGEERGAARRIRNLRGAGMPMGPVGFQMRQDHETDLIERHGRPRAS